MKSITILLLISFSAKAQQLSTFSKPLMDEEELTFFMKTLSDEGAKEIEMDTLMCQKMDHYISNARLDDAFLFANYLHDISLKLNSTKYHLIALWHLGDLYKEKRKWKKAFQCLKKTAEIARNLELNTALQKTYFIEGKIYCALMEFDKAQEKFDEIESLYKTYGNTEGIEKMLFEIAELYLEHNQQSAAARYYFKLLNQSALTELHRFASYIRIGEYYHGTAIYDKAIAYMKEALKCRPTNIKDRISVLWMLSSVYTDSKEVNQAFSMIQQAIQLTDSLGLKMSSSLKNDYAVIMETKNQLEEAVIIFKELLQEAIDEKDYESMSIYYNNIGWILIRQEKYDQSLSYLLKALEINETTEEGVSLITLDNLGYLFLKRKEYQKAASYYEKQKDYMSIVSLDDFSYKEEKQGYLDVYTVLNTGLVNAYFHMGKIEKAFYFAESNKANLLNEMRNNNVHKQLQITPEYLRKKAILEKGIEQTLEKQSRVKEKESIIFDVALDRQLFELQVLDKGLTKKDLLIKKDELLQAEVVEQIQSVLKTNELLLEYAFDNHGDEAILFYVSNNDFGAVLLDSTSKIKEGLENYRELVGKKLLENQLNYRRFLKLAVHLYDLLLRPLEVKKVLKGKELIIIPEMELSSVPFEALIKDGIWKSKTNADLDFLIKHHKITYYPSATTLYKLRIKKNKSQQEYSKQVLAIGDPDFKFLNIVGANFGQLTKLNRLPFSGKEVTGIGEVFHRSTILKGNQATETYLKQSSQDDNLKDYQIIHFSTHSVINEKYPELSYIALSKDENSNEDGFLYSYELSDFNFKSDLIVLSACHTGLGKYVKGEGVVGFSQALMQSGTSSLILSLWAVDDESTADLFIYYYRRLKDANYIDKQKALRETQLGMLESNSRWSNPYYWAPFVFIGER